jgi:hypothetical protein
MAYSREFFEFQLRFAQALAARFGLPLGEALYSYTTFTKSLAIGGRADWQAYMAALGSAPDPAGTTFEFYRARLEPDADPQPGDTSYYGHALFGCFYYVMRGATIIRPHFVNNERPGRPALGAETAAERRGELARMFAHVRAHVPAARSVLGNSWLYNLEAYRRLFPPAYTARTPEGDEGEFQFLARWGQCFDRQWQVRPDVGDELLRRLARLDDLGQLRHCFPYQILRPRCPVRLFYRYYGVDTAGNPREHTD